MAYSETSSDHPEPQRELPASITEELATAVMRAQAFTSATGAAIALTEDGEMVCRAASGTTAPDVGVHLSIEGSFTGLAVTTGKAVRCDDSDSDARVDAAACRVMHTRSMCVVPLRERGLVIGVLAVFSSVPHAFSEYHVAVLKTMADLIGQSMERSRNQQGPAKKSVAQVKPVPVPPRTNTPPPRVDTPPPQASAPPPVSKPTPEVPPAPKVIPIPQPAPAIGQPHAQATAPALAPKVAEPEIAPLLPPKVSEPVSPPLPPSFLPLPRVAAPEVVPVADSLAPSAPVKRLDPPPFVPLPKPTFPAPPVVPPVSKEKKAEPKREVPVPVAVPSFGDERGSIFSAEAAKPAPHGKSLLMVGGVAVAAIAVAFGVWLLFSGSKPAINAETPAAASQPVAAPAEAAPAPAVETPKPAESNARQTTTTIPESSVRATEGTRQDSPQRESQQPAEPEPAPVMVAGGSVAAQRPPATPDVEAPQVSLSSASGLPALGSAEPVVPTLRTVTVPPRLLTRVNPTYPLVARQMGMRGSVTVAVTINSRGQVTQVRPLSGSEVFFRAASDAIKQWKYQPQTVNGEPVESVVNVTVNFERPRQ